MYTESFKRIVESDERKPFSVLNLIVGLGNIGSSSTQLVKKTESINSMIKFRLDMLDTAYRIVYMFYIYK